MDLWFDSETHSTVPIRRGTDVYLDHATAIIASWAHGEEESQSADLINEQMPSPLIAALDDPSVKIINHNVPFDRMVLRKCLGRDIPLSRFHCTYAQALAHALPGGLGALCTVLGVSDEQSKSKDGMKYIRKFCGPAPCDPDSDWSMWEDFLEYARLDVEAMRECYKRMPNWNYVGDERFVWEADQMINQRGFAIDLKFAQEAVKALSLDKSSLDYATSQATGGVVTAATQRDKFLMYMCEVQGLFLPDLKAATIDQALEDESIDESTRELLRLRRESSKSSTSKFKRLEDSVGTDGRLRYTLQYSGASRTARWAGRIFQPQNLPRAPKPNDDTYGCLNECIELVRTGQAHLVPLYAPLSEVCSKGLRGLIVSEPGKKLVVADWNAIEGRVNAWVAGEKWKIAAFKDPKEDLYCRIYERSFGLTLGSINKKSHPSERQNGKVLELFGGYGGGVGACINMSNAYNVDLDVMGAAALRSAPQDAIDKARKTWKFALDQDATFGLSEDTYVGCDILKILYRRANPAIAKLWFLLEDAAKAVIAGGPAVSVGPVVFDANDQYMRIKLPSGRYLCYARPRLSPTRKNRMRKHLINGAIEIEQVEDTRMTISYMAWRNKAWSRTPTYGGKLCENIVQAISRDLLAWALLKLHDVVLHIHDEIILEVPDDGTYGLDNLIRTMITNPPWARGLPLAAEGFEGYRYEKR